MKINLYDFDNTIYNGDSSTDFFFYALMNHPKCYKYLPKCVKAFILYKFKKISKTKMKEQFFSFLVDIKNIDALVLDFWKCHDCYIKDFYRKKDHSKDIIISASPEFLLKPITETLEVKELIGSKVNKMNGKFTGFNCHGEEKVKRLKEKYKNFEVIEAYSDSKSDLPILRLAKKAYFVKGNKIKQADI